MSLAPLIRREVKRMKKIAVVVFLCLLGVLLSACFGPGWISGAK